MIPEDLIFDSDKLQAICDDLPPVDSIDDSKAKLKAVADSTGYDFGNLISILTTSFIKTKNEDYQYMLALLKSLLRDKPLNSIRCFNDSTLLSRMSMTKVNERLMKRC